MLTVFTKNLFRFGGKALHCAMHVAESMLIDADGIVNETCLQILTTCVIQHEVDLSHEFSGLVLRKFEPVRFRILQNFFDQYVVSAHFAKDPRYFFEYLTECAAIYPVECLELLQKMHLPFAVDLRETAYMGDEPLVLILAIYSKLRNLKFRFRKEQEIALDEFDRMLGIPSVRIQALSAMDKVLQ